MRDFLTIFSVFYARQRLRFRKPRLDYSLRLRNTLGILAILRPTCGALQVLWRECLFVAILDVLSDNVVQLWVAFPRAHGLVVAADYRLFHPEISGSNRTRMYLCFALRPHQ